MKMKRIGDLKILTLVENFAAGGNLGQAGLSLLLEFQDAGGEHRKVIFDTGDQKEALLYNIKHLEADLSDVDCIVLSHGHHDHTATTVEIVKASGGVKIYAHPHTFLHRFYKGRKWRRGPVGVPDGESLDAIEKAGGDVLLTTEPTEVVPGLWTTGQIERVTPFEHALQLSSGERSIIVVDGVETDDEILDDQALWMDVEKIGPFVVTGCAHAGPINTLLQVQELGHFDQIYALVGGTHLVGRPEEYVDRTVEELNRFRLNLISPCHCTGFKAMSRLWHAFPDSFILNFSGRVLEAGKEPERRVI
jgi:7,8-dihydropterin-6-yl-methyl-4-(beta-D-ribofuranosyl)aminobenzene 5'-phosphate synthase